MFYSLKYKMPGQWFWRKIKNIQADTMIANESGQGLPVRVIITANEERWELPMTCIIKFSKERVESMREVKKEKK